MRSMELLDPTIRREIFHPQRPPATSARPPVLQKGTASDAANRIFMGGCLLNRYNFVDNEYYFKRAALYGHYDDGERFGFFSRAIVALLAR